MFPDKPVSTLNVVSAGILAGEAACDDVRRRLVDRHEAVDRVRVVVEDARAADVWPYQVCGGATCMTAVGVIGFEQLLLERRPHRVLVDGLVQRGEVRLIGTADELELFFVRLTCQPNWRTQLHQLEPAAC